MKQSRWGWFVLIAIITLAITGAHTSSAARNNSPLPQSSQPLGAQLELNIELFASGLTSPVGFIHSGVPGDSRMFAIEQGGRLKIVDEDGAVTAQSFLNITDRVTFGGEMGLLGLAFHPNYENNGYFYVNYTTGSGASRRTHISRFEVTGNPNVADPNSENILLTVTQPATNHNAGDIHFGPDGYLYVPLGDGGGSGDTENNAQTMTTLLGKIVRIDVDQGAGAAPDCESNGTGDYTIPNDNPFIDGSGGDCDEIWALGLRNPWRSSFDRDTGDYYIGDVGQGSWEEIDMQPAASTGGENYGWRCYEGNHTFNTTGCGPMNSYDFPIFEYQRSGGNCAVMGGYVYRGERYPAMFGYYLLADYCSGNFWDLVPDGLGGWDSHMTPGLGPTFDTVAFGQDAEGELYLVSDAGDIYHIREDTYRHSLTPLTGNQSIDPGETATYQIRINNLGNVQDTYDISAEANPAWDIDLPSPVTINAGGQSTFSVMITAPSEAAAGNSSVMTVTVTSQSAPLLAETVARTTSVNQIAGVDLGGDGQAKVGAIGASVIYTHTLTNTGNGSDTYTLLLNSSQGWPVSASPNPTVAAGASTVVSVTVEVPGSAQENDVDMTTLTARSQADNNVEDSVTDTTTAFSDTPVLGVEVGTANNQQESAPGTSVDYAIAITNTGEVTDTYLLTSQSQQGWTLTHPPSVVIPPQSSQNVTLTVQIPTDASGGISDQEMFSARSSLDSQIQDSLALVTTTTTDYGVEVTAADEILLGNIGHELHLRFTVTNTGNVPDTFALAADVNQPWPVDVAPSLLLSPGEVGLVEVVLQLPDVAVPNALGTVTLLVTSTGDGSIEESVSTVVRARYVKYAPIIAEGS